MVSVPSATEFGSIVAAISTFPEPLNETEPVTSPLMLIVRAVWSVVAVVGCGIASAEN